MSVPICRSGLRPQTPPLIFSRSAFASRRKSSPPARGGDNQKLAFTLAEGATHVDISRNNRRAAFTLAEVLITLGVIGIVAAMTLPSLVGKANEFILKQQFKKAYSTILNAHNRVFAEYGSYPRCYYVRGSTTSAAYLEECNQYWDLMKKFLAPTSVCENNAYSRGCIPKYKGLDNITTENNPNLTEEQLAEKLEIQKRNCGSWFESRIDNGKAFVLNDGTIMLFTGTQVNYGLIMAIDVNGNKKPNKWGYDIFHFILRGDDKYSTIEPMYGGCAFIEKGGKYANYMLQEVYRK